MKQFAVQKAVRGIDLKRLRNKLNMTQADFAVLVNVSKKTIERWESCDKEITGPITTLLSLMENDTDLAVGLEIPEKAFPLRMIYMFRNQVCTVIDIDDRNRKIKIYNYRKDYIYRAFGKEEHPTYEQYEDFLESRCFSRNLDKMKLMLKELSIPFYDPMLIVQRTEGRMAEDEFWLKIERGAYD